MPTNHGIYRHRVDHAPRGTRRGPEHLGIFRYGIRQIFTALRTITVTANAAERASQLEIHFGKISERFLYSLQHLNTLMQAIAAEFNRETVSQRGMSLHLEAAFGSTARTVVIAALAAAGYSLRRSA